MVLNARYVENIKHYFDNPEKTPFNSIMGNMLDQCEYFRDYRLTHKGNCYGIKFICCIGMLGIYAGDIIILVALG